MSGTLLRALVIREFKGRYRRSLLGPLWAVIQPLAYMVVFSFLQGMLGIQTGDVPRVIFTFAALVPWTFFTNATIRAAPSILANAGIIKKVKVRAELFPLAAVLLSAIDLLIALAILLAMMAWLSVPVTAAVLWLPLLVFMVAVLAFGIGLGSSALGTFRQDVIFVIPFLMQFWMLVTPLLYPLTSVSGRMRSIYVLNPMVGIVEGFRSIFVYGVAPDLGLLAVSAAVTVVILAVAWPLFRFTSGYYADVL